MPMAFCSHCGTQLTDGANFCPNCGNATSNQKIVYIQTPQQDIYVHARKSKGLAMTLCFFGGWFGLHEFYLRNYLSVVFMPDWSAACSLSVIQTSTWCHSVLHCALYILLRSACLFLPCRWYGITCLTC